MTLKHLSLKDALLPQPPSFVKKQLYEVHEVLGTGTFGKVVVSCIHDTSLRGISLSISIVGPPLTFLVYVS